MNGRYGKYFTEDDVYKYHVKGEEQHEHAEGTIKDLFKFGDFHS